VTSYNRQVLLTGEALNAEVRQKAEQIVLRVENVRGVYNELVVGTASTLRRALA
jgi:osmotically-inducible protein OsmY